MRWSAMKPMSLLAIKASQRWSRARGEKAVDADSKAKLVAALWRRKDRPSLG
jgi:hypothetical protein